MGLLNVWGSTPTPFSNHGTPKTCACTSKHDMPGAEGSFFIPPRCQNQCVPACVTIIKVENLQTLHLHCQTGPEFMALGGSKPPLPLWISLWGDSWDGLLTEGMVWKAQELTGAFNLILSHCIFNRVQVYN